jgi:hypothetical protein
MQSSGEFFWLPHDFVFGPLKQPIGPSLGDLLVPVEESLHYVGIGFDVVETVVAPL